MHATITEEEWNELCAFRAQKKNEQERIDEGVKDVLISIREALPECEPGFDHIIIMDRLIAILDRAIARFGKH